MVVSYSGELTAITISTLPGRQHSYIEEISIHSQIGLGKSCLSAKVFSRRRPGLTRLALSNPALDPPMRRAKEAIARS